MKPKTKLNIPVTKIFLGLLALYLSVAQAWAVNVSFDDFEANELVTTQLRNESGVFFPNGIAIKADSRARSADNVVLTRFVDEFQREPLVIEFASGQDSVSFYVQGETRENILHWALVRAYDATGRLINSNGATFTSNMAWQYISVIDPSENLQISRVEVIGGQIGHQTNMLIFDDLEFMGAEIPPPPIDEFRPQVNIIKPFDVQSFTTKNIAVEFTASDNLLLKRVFASIYNISEAGDFTKIRDIETCGSVFSGVCSNPVEYNNNVWLENAETGFYRIHITAIDSSDNIRERWRNFRITLPIAPPELTHGSVKKVEINQGVQNRLFDIGLPNDNRFVSSPAILLAGRDTVVRFYPLIDETSLTTFTGTMRSRITLQDDSTREYATLPNAGLQAIPLATIPEDVGQLEAEYLLMRTRLDRTLNYVIPSTKLLGAKKLEVRLENSSQAVTGWLQVSLNPEVRLAIHEVELVGSGIPAGTVSTALQRDLNFRYVEETYPVSEVIRLPAPPVNIMRDIWCESHINIFNEKTCAMLQFLRYNITTTPLTQIPTYEVALGWIPFDSFSRVGMAINHSAIAMAYVDAGFAHEIGHAVGRPHAGGAHGEAGGELWPHPHGLIGERDFGVISTQTSLTEGVFGQWNLLVVDPCPVSIVDRIPDCYPNDIEPSNSKGTHDFMSYGRGDTDLGFFNTGTLSRNWVSTHTWNRLYQKMRNEGHVATFAASLSDFAPSSEASPTNTDLIQQEALLIDAVISEDSVNPLPVLRLLTSRAEMAEPNSGPYSLELYNTNGELTYSRSFDVSELHDVSEKQVFLMNQQVPLQTDLARIVVNKENSLLFERTRSANPPTVKILCPFGGRDDVTGKHTVFWDASDADDDPLISSIFFSDNDGLSWQNLGMVGSNEAHELDVNAARLSAFNKLRFRVAVSDGFLTSVAESGCSLDPRDNTPPTLAPVINKTVLWPPNRKMVDISIDTHAKDDSGAPVYLQAVVNSNERAGYLKPDWSVPVITRTNGTIDLQLRAERSGKGEGRIYTITIIATDESGNSRSVNMEVKVPHHRKKKHASFHGLHAIFSRLQAHSWKPRSTSPGSPYLSNKHRHKHHFQTLKKHTRK